MSATISYTISLTHNIASGCSTSITPVTISKAVAESYVAGQVTILSASATAFPLGLVTTPVLAYIRNLDSTNFITLTDDSNAMQIVIEAGETALIPLSSGLTTLEGQADTANCEVFYAIFEAA